MRTCACRAVLLRELCEWHSSSAARAEHARVRLRASLGPHSQRAACLSLTASCVTRTSDVREVVLAVKRDQREWVTMKMVVVNETLGPALMWI